MPMPTLLDIAKLAGTDALVGLIEEAGRAHPEITAMPWRSIKGLNFKVRVRTGLPTAGFRDYGEGVAASKSAFANRLFETYLLNPRWECDRAIADVYEDGAPAFLAIEGAGMLEAAFQAAAKQVYYGVGAGGDAKGFPGLLACYDSTNMVVDATGTTATTGSSVWAVSFGPQSVQWVVGNGGQIALSDPVLARVTDAATNPFTAYVQEILARIGLQVSSTYCIARIKKLTADAGKGLTDILIAQLLGKFPVGYEPNALFMTKRSLMQLQSSRTATSPTGAPAPIPDSAFGIPILVTESILNTEALTL
jgi:hypothetical protein